MDGKGAIADGKGTIVDGKGAIADDKGAVARVKRCKRRSPEAARRPLAADVWTLQEVVGATGGRRAPGHEAAVVEEE
eukprot:4121027-Pyramimonas_sp.AAC.1